MTQQGKYSGEPDPIPCAGCGVKFSIYASIVSSLPRCPCLKGGCQADNEPSLCSRWLCGGCRMWFEPPRRYPVRPAPAARNLR